MVDEILEKFDTKDPDLISYQNEDENFVPSDRLKLKRKKTKKRTTRTSSPPAPRRKLT